MGHLNDAVILSKVKKLPPKVRLIILRDSWGALALLEPLGFDTSQVLTPGDGSD